MWALVCIAHLWIRFCFTFPLKARRALQRQNCSRQNSNGVQLCAVLVTFGFSENLIVDSAQC